MSFRSYEKAKQLFDVLVLAIEESKELSHSSDEAALHAEDKVTREMGGLVLYLPKDTNKCKV